MHSRGGANARGSTQRGELIFIDCVRSTRCFTNILNCYDFDKRNRPNPYFTECEAQRGEITSKIMQLFKS